MKFIGKFGFIALSLTLGRFESDGWPHRIE